ncbi:MAG TPA: hypothetical protein VMM92_05580 [Thermoanaerobaculia bacterium]|nr:hypothetical protein [Thermoanaerobaculia bacterium]
MPHGHPSPITTGSSHAAGRRELLAMAVFALSLRIALFALATGLTHTTFAAYAGAADGYQYLSYAHAWRGDAADFVAHPYYRRLFPGYPALIAALSVIGVPEAAAALLPSWLAAPFVAVLAALYFGDRRVGWAMAALTPAYVFSGSLISTEALCLLFSLAGLWLAGRDRASATSATSVASAAWGAGVAFGLGGLFRPVAVFAMLGAVAREVIGRRFAAAVALTATAGLTVASGLALVHWRFGDALMSLNQYKKDPQAYAGELFTWPFKSLLTVPLTTPVPAWKLAYVGVHALAVLLACALAVRQGLQREGEESRGLSAVAAVWLLGNTLYVLSIGNIWGFHDFPRFIVPALPPLFWVLRRFLPRRPIVWLALGLLCVVLSLPPAKRRLESPPAPPVSAAAVSTAGQSGP